jgi:putative transposase
MDKLVVAYRGWIDEALSQGEHFRDGKWTESVAVGSESFVTTTKEKLGVKGKGVR